MCQFNKNGRICTCATRSIQHPPDIGHLSSTRFQLKKPLPSLNSLNCGMWHSLKRILALWHIGSAPASVHSRPAMCGCHMHRWTASCLCWLGVSQCYKTDITCYWLSNMSCMYNNRISVTRGKIAIPDHALRGRIISNYVAFHLMLTNLSSPKTGSPIVSLDSIRPSQGKSGCHRKWEDVLRAESWICFFV